MPRARNPNSIKAENLYLKHNGEIELTKIAKELNVSPGTVRSWKNRYNWNDKINATLQKDKRNVANKKTKKVPPSKEPKLKEELVQLENADLTDKQRLFCVYYIKCFNATKAYQKAYESDYNTAMANGCRLLGNAKIGEEIKRLKANKFKGAFLEKEDILQKYLDIAFSDITDYVQFGQEEIPVMGAFGPIKDDDGNTLTTMINVVKFNESSSVDGTIISEVKQGKSGASVKLQDKMKALNFLAKNIGLLDMVTQEKLRMEQEKLELLKRKDSEDEDGGQDDGFLEALKASAKDVWSDEDE